MKEIKPTPIENLKVGDKIRLLFPDENPDSEWEEVFDISHKSSVYAIAGFSSIGKPWFYDTDGTDWFVDNDEWPCLRLDPAEDNAEDKENTYQDSFKKIPEFDIHFAYSEKMMTDKQKEMVIQEAKDKARGWVLRNYTAWPHGFELDFQVEGRTLKSKWVYNNK